jgi:hypothetical protein
LKIVARGVDKDYNAVSCRKSTGALTCIARIKLNERLWLRMRKDRVG